MKRLILIFLLIASHDLAGQSYDPNRMAKVKEAIKEFKDKDSGMNTFFNESYGYAVFPSVGKGGIGIGAAHGNGIVFKRGKATGETTLSQASIGLQLGGQSYREVIFFKDKGAYDRFTAGKFKFAAQVSAVAASEGASADAAYQEGVAIFTMTKGGLMYEASVGGQKFKFSPH